MNSTNIENALIRELRIARLRFEARLSTYAPNTKLKKSGRLTMLSANPAIIGEPVRVNAIQTIAMENAEVPALEIPVSAAESLKFLLIGNLLPGLISGVSSYFTPVSIVLKTSFLLITPCCEQ